VSTIFSTSALTFLFLLLIFVLLLVGFLVDISVPLHQYL
jgi:hypothetical protein